MDRDPNIVDSATIRSYNLFKESVVVGTRRDSKLEYGQSEEYIGIDDADLNENLSDDNEELISTENNTHTT